MDIVVADVDVNYGVMVIVHDTIQRSPYDGGRYGAVLVALAISYDGNNGERAIALL